MELIKRKKGMFFTLAAVVIILLFLVSFSMYNEVQNRKSIQKRVETMSSFVDSMKDDLSRQLYISGYRIIFFALQDIYKQKPITDIDAFFQKAIVEGKIGDSSVEEPAMSAFKLDSIISASSADASQIGAKVTLSNPRANLTQTDPWNVKVILKVDFVLEDKSGIAKWNETGYEIVSYIPITEFEDPIYYIGTSGNVINKIVRSPYSFPPSVNDLKDHINNSYYIENPLAPSFLERLEGNLTGGNNVAGIESIINYLEIENALGPENVFSSRSVVDYEYFKGSNNPTNNYVSMGLPAWFKLDSDHESTYGVSGGVPIPLP